VVHTVVGGDIPWPVEVDMLVEVDISVEVYMPVEGVAEGGILAEEDMQVVGSPEEVDTPAAEGSLHHKEQQKKYKYR